MLPFAAPLPLPEAPETPAATADILARLRAGDPQPLDELYCRHRRVFLKWAHLNYPTLPPQAHLDAYQQGIVSFYENFAQGRLQELTVALATYVFRLADRACQKMLRNRAETINISEARGINRVGAVADGSPMPQAASFSDELVDDPFGSLTDDGTPDDATLARRELLQRGMQQLSADCRRLLLSFYYHNQSFEAISVALGYRDEAVARVRKSQCLKKLRTWCLPASR